jgi:hypothetical protein
MDVTVLSAFLAKIAAVSVAAERIVESLKGWFPNTYLFATKTDPASEMRRSAWIHVLAGVAGAAVAVVGKVNIFGELGVDTPLWASYLGAGLLASGGSAMWNHALDLLKAAKINKQQDAIATVSVNQQQKLLSSAHPASLALAMLAPQSSGILPAKATCVITGDPTTGAFKAPIGVITLKLSVLTGSFNFVPKGCSVTDPAKKDVTFSQKTTSELQFSANIAGTYKLRVLYAFSPASKAQLLEDCSAPESLDDLNETVPVPKTYTFEIS